MTLLQLTQTTAAKTVTHISQLVISEEFQQFDYGAEENLKRYGSTKPPQYDLSKLRVPIYLIRSDNDNLSAKEVNVVVVSLIFTIIFNILTFVGYRKV